MDTETRTDEALMHAYARGDATALRAIFRRFAPPIRAIAVRSLRSLADADEVVQQTFLQVHRARHDFRAGARLRPWIFTIARNLMRDVGRRRGRVREVPLELDGPFEPTIAADAPVEREQRAALVHEALEHLPDDQRRAIELHWWDELPFAEVAARVGATETAVKVRAHRGYRRMRAWLETNGEMSRT